ncbi:acetylornithine aminotransferase [Kribbella sp. ALI-6-A]|uniref:acetylornithine transaminase n=1 Tax=Kribbella sp. ALI-6-A TaxID=1933817 RepID=UPI00097C0EB7|nr:acetylornithine transaminase [Kribbella sp. ALI-6-A]ONI71949.1 acetylornithine aminotransferase [Kribbella sp. ALI-6-A]
MTELMPPELSELSTTSSTGAALTERYTHSLMNTFGPPKKVLVRGEGAYLWDADGKKYLDLLGGLAVNSLGHAHPFVVSAVTSQLTTLGHVSNFFASAPQIALAEKLLSLIDAPGGKVFFTNSGTEANEAAFKITRKTGRTKIVSTVGAFHGRSMGALAITWKPAYRELFAPLPGDVTFVPYGDAAALEAAVDDETAAVVLEPIQGENGVVVPPAGYLQAARRITSEHNALLWIDEIQTGIGRTGDWFAFQAEGIVPDLVTVAKGLGAGIPIGACLGFGAAADLLQPGNHGTTFGGNPVASIAGLAVLTVIERDGLLANVSAVGNHLAAAVEALDHPLIAGVRGRGLLLAIELTQPVSDQVAALALEAGFVINNPIPDALRLAPPYILTKADVDSFVSALPDLLNKVEVS